MRTGIVAFILGNVCFLYLLPFDWSELNRTAVSVQFLSFFTVVFLFLLLYKARTVIVSSLSNIYQSFYKSFLIIFSALLCGYLFTAIYINQFYPVLDLQHIEGKDIRVKGYVDSIPDKSEKKTSFLFFITAREVVDQAGGKRWDEDFNGKVKLSWYRNKQVIRINEQRQLTIRLKKPNGLLNGVFDYEKWLFQNRILATGYVRSGKKPEADEGLLSGNYLSNLRQIVAVKLDESLSDYAYKGLIKALTIGIRHDIEFEQWQQFLRTGTNHLIAISGLHISLMAGIAWFLVNYLWRASITLNLMYPSTKAASVIALIVAVLYASLAGFAIPTQRALIMLSVVFVALMLNRELRSSYLFLLALFLVVVFDPLSTLSPGFWLSFGAVAVILYSISSRLSHKSGLKAKLFQLGWLQIIIFIGLLSPLIILFNQFSLLSPLANMIAVPLMSFIVVPLTFMATIFLFIYEPLGQLLFSLLIWPIEALFWVLAHLSQWSVNQVFLPASSWSAGLLVIIGSFWLLMPKGWPGRWLGLMLFFPVLFSGGEKIPDGQVKMTVLDVGQGLAMVIRTRNHILLYDTGDKYSAEFNMADMVIIPYLRLSGINMINKLIISHSDRDHAGSFYELIEQLKIGELLSGESDRINVNLSSNSHKNFLNRKLVSKQCQQGQQWQWDNVSFRVLSPKAGFMPKKNNNLSCVIHIKTATGGTLLLTGDIEKTSEKQIIKDYPDLKAQVLQVPHHGSKTSSSKTFLKTIQPKIALFSFGYRNRFKFPAQKVLQRYQKMQISLYNTSNGAIEINANITNNSFSVIEYRVEKKMLWHRAVNQL